jgi:hypothetical protein
MNSKNGFSWTEFEMFRRIPYATMGIFVSSYCPVECGHCAVSASSDFEARPSELLIRCVEEMVQVSELKAVAITGGEPFAEFELLESLTNIVHSARKRLVIYTSGYWGKYEDLSEVEPVLQLADGLVLGIDLYHRAHIPDDVLIKALRRACECGIWIAAQVISDNDDTHLTYARRILENAYGEAWDTYATIVENSPLPSGRAENIRSFNQSESPFGEYCYSINGPTLLRDGTLAACCNEHVVLNKGPEQFRVSFGDSIQQSLEELEHQPLLGYLRRVPPTVLRSLASMCIQSGDLIQPARLCQACWDFCELYAQMNADQRDQFDGLVDIYLDIQKPSQEQELGPFPIDLEGLMQSDPEQVSDV